MNFQPSVEPEDVFAGAPVRMRVCKEGTHI